MGQFVISVFLFFVALSPYAFAQKLNCYVLSPPEKSLEGARKIAIMTFHSGNDPGLGGRVTDLMNAYLLMNGRGLMGKTYIQGARTNIFQVVEREDLNRIFEEQRLGLSGLIDERSTQEVGKILGVDAIIIGEVSYDYRDEPKAYAYTKDNVEHTRECTQRMVVVTGNMKIISVKTGELLGTVIKAALRFSEKCDDDRASLPGVESLAHDAAADVAWYLVDYFSPVFVRRSFDFEKLKIKAYKKEAKRATAFIKNDQLEDACVVYNALYKKDPYFPDIPYNLGAIHEIYANYEKAQQYYKRAYDLQRSNEKYFSAFERAKSGLILLALYESMGIYITFPDLDAEMAAKGLLKTNGSMKDRFSVYEAPSADSREVVKVPGNIELNILEEAGNWYLIELLDGKKGYIAREYVTVMH